MNRDRTVQKMKEMTVEELTWIEGQAKTIRESKSNQKSRSYTLHEDKRSYQPRPKQRECIPLLGGDGASLAAASLHTFFNDSFAKHHPGDFPENFYDE